MKILVSLDNEKAFPLQVVEPPGVILKGEETYILTAMADRGIPRKPPVYYYKRTVRVTIPSSKQESSSQTSSSQE